MGFLFGVMLPLLSIASFVGFVWLVTIAFRTSAIWGLGVLFLSPFSAIIFAVKNWQETKKPFLIYAGSFMAAMVLVLGMGGFAVMSMANAAQTMEFDEATDEGKASGNLDAGERKKMQQMQQTFDEITAERQTGGDALKITLTGLEPVGDEVEPAPYDEAISTSFNAKTWQGEVPLHRADEFVGRFVNVTTRKGSVYRGRLAEVDRKEFRFERDLASGKVTIYEKRSDVRSLEIKNR